MGGRGRGSGEMVSTWEAARRHEDFSRGALAVLLTTVEREVVLEVAAFLRDRGWRVEGITHDGMLVRALHVDHTRQKQVDPCSGESGCKP